MNEKIKYSFVKGDKSKSDRIVIIDSNKEAWSFKDAAMTVALIAKNEQTISAEIEHYNRGSDLFRDYLMKIFEKNWIIVPDNRMWDELNDIYHQTNILRTK